jgi:aspartate/glutamate racemase
MERTIVVTRNKIGIVSGAGPMAGIVLAQKIVQLQQSAGAYKDSDFVETILHQIPFADTTAHGLPIGGAVDTTAQLHKSLNLLKRQGCTKTVIACNSMYAYDTTLCQFGLLSDYVSYALDYLERQMNSQGSKQVVIISSASCALHKVFRRRLRDHHLELIPIDSYEQTFYVDKMIDAAMKGVDQTASIKSLMLLLARKYDAVPFLACTELCLTPLTDTIPHFNSLDIMANYALDTPTF